MSRPVLEAVGGFAVAGGACAVLTPVAIRAARATDFMDRPREYRQHAAATPFLGGAAVLLGFVLAAGVLGLLHGKLLVVVACAGAMLAIGTLDDRIAVPPKWRLLLAALTAVALDRVGLGWETSGGPVVGLGLTVIWVVGLVNAFNLMDNQDGACATVAAVAAAGTGVLALIEHQAAAAGLAFALCGACLVFLRWNLATPSRIFLGDGGSMSIGFLAAALAMAVSRHAPAGNAGLLVGAMLVGLPILDVALVSLSRTRRGVTLMTGGRDHVTHRLLLELRTPRRVAVALALTQATLSVAAISAYELGAVAVFAFGFTAFLLGLTAVLVLDRDVWRPAGIAMAPDPVVAGAAPDAILPGALATAKSD